MPRWWGTHHKGRAENNATFAVMQIKRTDRVILRIIAGATQERHWQVIQRLVLQEWARLKAEQAAILNRPVPNEPPIARWYASLEVPAAELIPEPATRDTRRLWQGSDGVPDAATVMEREGKRAVIGKTSGQPAVDEMGRILDAGGEWREMTPAEDTKYGKLPSYRERRAKRRAEVEAALKRRGPASA